MSIDTCFVIFDPDFIRECYKFPKGWPAALALQAEMETNRRMMSTVVEECQTWPEQSKIAQFVEALAVGFTRTYVGMYSVMHEKAAIK